MLPRLEGCENGERRGLRFGSTHICCGMWDVTPGRRRGRANVTNCACCWPSLSVIKKRLAHDSELALQCGLRPPHDTIGQSDASGGKGVVASSTRMPGA